ncbi:MAG TPA: NAD(P)H-dependent oxidoreductase [Candidatus Paceibacterota bacterium]|nr:NAD(P)H-dependent oxidoreductase [Candidatus Paceibacterota bacterium]
MRVFVFLGHSDPATLSGALADCYETHAHGAGHEVRRMNLSDMRFDPILHQGYKTIQELEPDLKTFQENVKWAEHVVFVYPTWWSSMPALMKGLFDRAWLPHYAFNFADHGLTWKKLLAGRTARIITSANTAPWLLRFMYGPPTVALELALLRFSGIRARSTVFSPSERASEETKAKWFRTVERLARCGC